jgi:predicted amidohydrolase YtcJ
MLSEQAKRTPEGHWVKVIGGWSPYQFEENRFPTVDEQSLSPALPEILPTRSPIKHFGGYYQTR